MRLWQLISPTLPIGAYAWSTGMEYAIDAGWIKNESDTSLWIHGQIRNSFPALDIPIFSRLYAAWAQHEYPEVIFWNQQLLAMRESAELYQEDLALGAALMKVLPVMGVSEPDITMPKKTFCSVFAYATQTLAINKQEAAQGLVWSWCENQVAAAIKLVPLGQTSGQRILATSIPVIAAAVEQGMCCHDDDIGVLMPGLAMASAMHELQYSRLFRS